MGKAYPELREKQELIQNVIRAEEEAFARTLETGLNLFDTIARRTKSAGATVIRGEDVFRLYDTYGFPYDLTEIMAAEHGLTLDKDGFDEAMGRQREQSRAGAAFTADADQRMQTIISGLQDNGLTEQTPTAVSYTHLRAHET